MNLLAVLASLGLIVLVSGVPVFRQGQDFADGIYEAEVTLEDTRIIQELLRQRRSLPEAEFEAIPFEELDHGMRAKRATCDLLSFSSQWVTVNHSACAFHCLTKGYKGGKCVDTICNCRN